MFFRAKIWQQMSYAFSCCKLLLCLLNNITATKKCNLFAFFFVFFEQRTFWRRLSRLCILLNSLFIVCFCAYRLRVREYIFLHHISTAKAPPLFFALWRDQKRNFFARGRVNPFLCEIFPVVCGFFCGNVDIYLRAFYFNLIKKREPKSTLQIIDI